MGDHQSRYHRRETTNNPGERSVCPGHSHNPGRFRNLVHCVLPSRRSMTPLQSPHKQSRPTKYRQPPSCWPLSIDRARATPALEWSMARTIASSFVENGALGYWAAVPARAGSSNTTFPSYGMASALHIVTCGSKRFRMVDPHSASGAIRFAAFSLSLFSSVLHRRQKASLELHGVRC